MRGSARVAVCHGADVHPDEPSWRRADRHAEPSVGRRRARNSSVSTILAGRGDGAVGPPRIAVGQRRRRHPTKPTHDPKPRPQGADPHGSRLSAARRAVPRHHHAAKGAATPSMPSSSSSARDLPRPPVDKVAAHRIARLHRRRRARLRAEGGFVPIRKQGKLPAENLGAGLRRSSTAPTAWRSTATRCSAASGYCWSMT